MNYSKELPDMDLRKKGPRVHSGAYIITMAALFAITLTMVSINSASAPSLIADLDKLQQSDETSAAQRSNVFRTYIAENLRSNGTPLKITNNTELNFNIGIQKPDAKIADIYLRFISADNSKETKPFNATIVNRRSTGSSIQFNDPSPWSTSENIQSPSIKSIIDTSSNPIQLLIKLSAQSSVRTVSQVELIIAYEE